jgi:hypothetical protein
MCWVILVFRIGSVDVKKFYKTKEITKKTNTKFEQESQIKSVQAT